MSGTILDRAGNPIHHCATPGCRERGIVYPQVIVPPRGHPLTKGVKAVVRLILCRKHGQREEVGTFLTDNFRAMLSATVARSPVPLDFDRATLKMRVVGDKPWRENEERAASARQRRAFH
jgi:hypothetical protein